MFHPLTSTLEAPRRFTYPFRYEPHPLCRLAAREVQTYLAGHEAMRQDADRGKMFGVLVVRLRDADSPTDSRLGFLAAYSGLLAGRNDWPYFVPPVYDAQQPDGYFKQREREISKVSKESIISGESRTSKELSQNLQQWLFHQYRLLNARGETKDLVDLWQEYYCRPKLRERYPLPPAGTGDCCAPKLLQYAYRQGLEPLCMAEFWWGRAANAELRRHLNYYPACQGKCKPLLAWMLQGLDVDPDPQTLAWKPQDIPIVYEDADIMVVDKPAGLLSVPGRTDDYSVQTVMSQRCPGSLVAHRLDQATSGLLIVAKTTAAYHDLQQQFVKHEVRKKYVAVIETHPSPPQGRDVKYRQPTYQHPSLGEGLGGLCRISLPLRPDPMNRPRQVVDREHGKRAVTDYEFLDIRPPREQTAAGRCVALYPQTGRTHQLRVHCAHPDGLGSPIVGDELYGTKGQRLLLHATELWFRHPVGGHEMHLVSPAPFLI